MTIVKIKEEDTWNFDDTLAGIIAQGLQHLLDGPAYQDHEMPLALECFKRYSERWEKGQDYLCHDAHDFTDEDKPEGQMMLWALEWLKNNFFGLWS